VHGRDGMDEISTTGPTLVTELKDGEIDTFEVRPEDFGIAVVDPRVLRGGTSAENAAALRDVLEGKPGPFADLVAINAAAALTLADRSADLAEGLAQARAAIASGRALAALEALKSATND
jgi:anthranilate phosphoribosyltransferase